AKPFNTAYLILSRSKCRLRESNSRVIAATRSRWSARSAAKSAPTCGGTAHSAFSVCKRSQKIRAMPLRCNHLIEACHSCAENLRRRRRCSSTEPATRRQPAISRCRSRLTVVSPVNYEPSKYFAGRSRLLPDHHHMAIGTRATCRDRGGPRHIVLRSGHHPGTPDNS